MFVTSVFRRSVNDVFALLGCYTASIGSQVTDVSGQPIGPIFKSQAVQEEMFSFVSTLKTQTRENFQRIP